MQPRRFRFENIWCSAIRLKSDRSDGLGPAAGHHAAAAIGGGDLPARPRLPGWLLVGSTGRNSGKTEFACAVIGRFRGSYPIVGRQGHRHRRRRSDLPAGPRWLRRLRRARRDFEIDEESGRARRARTPPACWRAAPTGSSGSDAAGTASMPPSGVPAAARSRALVVAESNSLALGDRAGPVPHGDKGARLVRQAHGGRRHAPGARPGRRVRRRRVRPESPGTWRVVDGTWHLAEASAAILAGGASSRMGQDKSLLPLMASRSSADPRPAVQWFDEILISTNEPAKYAFLGARPSPTSCRGRDR
jgi:hypothetical protein